MDKSQYQQIQALIEQNSTISGFDLYYLGFFSHFVPKFTLQEIFTHIANIISLHNDQLINNQEKIEFLIRMLSKKIAGSLMKNLVPQADSTDTNATDFLHEYFSQILKIIPQYSNVSNFELFYLGHFHAICPAYKIAELFHHINNINQLVTEDLIDEETQVDFLLKILNKKIMASNGAETTLNIPQESHSPFRQQDNKHPNASPNYIMSTQDTAAFRLETDAKSTPLKSLPSLKSHTDRDDNEVDEGEEERQGRWAQKGHKETVEERTGLSDDGQADDQMRGEASEIDHRDLTIKDNMHVERGREDEDKMSEEGQAQLGSLAQKILSRNRLAVSNYSQEYPLKKQNILKQFSFQNSAASEDRNSGRPETNNENEAEEHNHMEMEEEKDDEEKNQREEENQSAIQEEEKHSEEFMSNKEIEGDVQDEHTNEHAEENREEEIEHEDDNRISIGDKTPGSGEFQGNNNVEEEEEEKDDKTVEREEQDQEEEKEQVMEIQSDEEEVEDKDNDKEADNVESFEEERHEDDNEVVSQGNVEDEHQEKRRMVLESQGEKSFEREDDHDEPNDVQSQHEQAPSQGPENVAPSIDNENLLRVPNQAEIDRLPGLGHATSSQSDNQSEVKHLMAQLYPDSTQSREKGTLEDILNNLLESDEGRSEASQRLQGRQSSLINASLESHRDGGLMNVGVTASQASDSGVITSGQEKEPVFSVPKSHRKELKIYEASLEIIDESRTAVSKEPAQALEEDKQIEEMPESQVRVSDTLEDLTNQTNPSQYESSHFAIPEPHHSVNKLAINESQISIPNAASLILRWKNIHNVVEPSLPNEDNQDNHHPFRELMLQQVVNQIQPSLMGEPIQTKQEETESRVYEANTMIDATQDDALDAGSVNMTPMVARTLNDNEHVEPSLRVCSTVKQTLSQLHRDVNEEEGMVIIDDKEDRKETDKAQKGSMEVEDNKADEINTKDNNGVAKEVQEKKKSDKENSRKVQDNIAESVAEPKGRMEEEVKVDNIQEKKGVVVLQNMLEDLEEVKVNNQKPSVIVELSKCSLCLEDLSEKSTTTLEVCSHRFHKDCLEDYLTKRIHEKVLPITCPRQECQHNLLLVDLMDLVDPDSQEKFILTALKAYVDTSADVCCCPTPGCAFAFLKTYRSSRFRCSLCKNTYCLSCHTEWHKGMSCEDYKATQKQETLDENDLVGKKVKQCPDCKTWVGKKPGSDNMECQCGTSFCYCCGKTKSQGCLCSQPGNERRPIVQPDLFHKAMQSPQEYRVFSTHNKGESGKMITSETFKPSGVSIETGHAYRPLQQDNMVSSKLSGATVQRGRDKKTEEDIQKEDIQLYKRRKERSPERERRRRDREDSKSRSRSRSKGKEKKL